MKNTDVNLSEIFVVVILRLGTCVLRALVINYNFRNKSQI